MVECSINLIFWHMFLRQETLISLIGIFFINHSVDRQAAQVQFCNFISLLIVTFLRWIYKLSSLILPIENVVNAVADNSQKNIVE